MNPKTKIQALFAGALLGIAVMIALAMIQDAHAMVHDRPPGIYPPPQPPPPAWVLVIKVGFRVFVPFLP